MTRVFRVQIRDHIKKFDAKDNIDRGLVTVLHHDHYGHDSKLWLIYDPLDAKIPANFSKLAVMVLDHDQTLVNYSYDFELWPLTVTAI